MISSIEIVLISGIVGVNIASISAREKPVHAKRGKKRRSLGDYWWITGRLLVDHWDITGRSLGDYW